ncbi:myotubularin-like protein [Achlya hypogyna]|uniref:phosphatidylinositol-3,5-bisphosphate 3-phosphatase n=1 Tax=Achlya hypogyna TaxID=1202772 RepID=A0A1V9ZL75_ACHHY|nr:myotubularin-like protein [Achlya hypogyna]
MRMPSSSKINTHSRMHMQTHTKEFVSISSLSDAAIAFRVLCEAHSLGLEKDEKDVVRATLKTVAYISGKLQHRMGTLQKTSAGELGVPHVGAAPQTGAPHCAKCSRSWNAFQRGHNCQACGYQFCSRCLTPTQLPRSFGFESPAKTCDLCRTWLAEFMNSKWENEHMKEPKSTTPKPVQDTPKVLAPANHSPKAFVALLNGALEKGLSSRLHGRIQTVFETFGATPHAKANAMGELKSAMTHLLADVPEDEDDDEDDEDESAAAEEVAKPPVRAFPKDALQTVLSLMIALEAVEWPDVEKDAGNGPLDEPPATAEIATPPVTAEMAAPLLRRESVSVEFREDGSHSEDVEGPKSPQAPLPPPQVAYFIVDKMETNPLFSSTPRKEDRFRLEVFTYQGMIRVKSIFNMSRRFTFRISDMQLVLLEKEFVRWQFPYRSELVLQFRSEATKLLFCKLIHTYLQTLDPTTRLKRTLPLVPFLRGEVKMHAPHFPTACLTSAGEFAWRGLVLVTNYRVLVVPFEIAPLVEIPLFGIVSVTREASFGSRSPYLLVTSKDVRALRLDVTPDDRLHTLLHLISKLSESTQKFQTGEPTKDSVLSLQVPHFSFSYTMTSVTPETNGWKFADIEAEYARQGLLDHALLQIVDNGDGSVCESYPTKLLFPAALGMAEVLSAVNFRAKNRVPLITWQHPRNHCVLTRSSQPLLGRLLTSQSCGIDEGLIAFYKQLSTKSSSALYIFDARKVKAAKGNRLMGKGGVEASGQYTGAIINHLNIANMYKMQTSYLALLKLCLSPEHDKSWWSALEATRWFEHLQLVLDGAVKIARVLEFEGASVLVHCSDGWDRTCQLVSLAQIMLDPHFRTMAGFAALVEKDWISFGHKFMERLGGNRAKDPARAKVSPIFLQFLDAVYQLTTQFPSAFEFDERFLLHVANALTSGLYGTFLYDSVLQRAAAGAAAKTVSVWTPLLVSPQLFRNAAYEPRPDPLWPWPGHQALKLWSGYYFQHHEVHAHNHIDEEERRKA